MPFELERAAPGFVVIGAGVLICAQHVPALTGLGWALAHGAGLHSLTIALPLALALAVLWAGYRLAVRRLGRRATPAVAAIAIGIVALNEMLLPTTPLQSWRGRRAVTSVQVLRIRDEPLLSARGNPIGVRISFDAVVPRTAGYLISTAALSSASGDSMWPLHFGQVRARRVQPPAAQGDGAYDVLQRDVVYTFTEDLLPNFIGYDERRQAPCLNDVTTPYITEPAFRSALAASRDIALRTEIHVSGEHGGVRTVAAQGVTSRRYDMQAMYDTIAKEEGGRCER